MLRDAGAGQHFAFALQLALGGVFLVSAAVKLRRPGAFVRTVADYGVLPRSRALDAGAAAAIVSVEALLAAAFFTGTRLAVATAVAAVILLTFAAGVGLNLRRGRTIPCGCFGSDTEVISSHTLTRIALLVVAVGTLALLVALPDARAVTVSDIGDEPEYLVGAGGIAVVLGLTGLWALNIRSVAAVARSFRHDPT